MINRREFIKSTITVAAALSITPTVLCTPTFSELVCIKYLGIKTIVTNDEAYEVLTYHLTADHPKKGTLQAYCNIDKNLLMVCLDKRQYINNELKPMIEAMEMTYNAM
jgi:hypothetical protein